MMKKEIMKDNFYNKLGLKPLKDRDKNVLNNSIKKNFNISNITNFNTNLSLFSMYNLDEKTLNNSKQILKIISKKKQVHVNGGLYKALVRFKGTKYITDVFTKECSVFNPLTLQINEDDTASNTNAYKKYMINDLYNNKNNSCNIELLCT